MHTIEYLPLLLTLLAQTTSALLSSNQARAIPRSLDALIVEPQEPTPTPSPSPILRHLDLRTPAPTTPFLRRLDLRQVAPAQPAANAQAPGGANAQAQPAANAQAQGGANAQAQPAAGAQAQPGANAQAQAPAKQAPAAPAAPAAPPANAGAGAPVAGGGGGTGPAGAQPAPGAQANPVTTIQVQTVIGGVTQTVPQVFSQGFGSGPSAPPVQTGSIGMGTLTGQIGVVKTDQAANDAISTIGGRGVGGAVLGILMGWVAVMAFGGGILGLSIS